MINKIKNKIESSINPISVYIFIGLLILLFILIGYKIGNSCKYIGIGGFVYKEIQWQEQTLNIMKKNCESGLFINDWENKNSTFLYCWKDECKGSYCKKVYWKSPIITPK